MTAALTSTLNQRPKSELELSNPDAPITDFDPSLWWQKRDAARTQQRDEIAKAARINPLADTLSVENYTSRLVPIKEIGQRALQGQIVSSQVQAERKRAAAAAQAERERQAAMNQAQANGAAFADGMGGYSDQGAGAGWGSGGAQGVANVLRAAGFSEDLVPIFMAIAKAESGWNPSALNTSNRNGTTDAGLFQINSVHKGNAWYPTNVNDPLQSAKAALAIYKSQGLGAWSVYNSGAYKQFLQPAPAVQTSVIVGNTPVTGAAGQIRLTAVQKAQNYANSGVGYVWGGNSLTTGVDCSGLVQQVYKSLGINLPRTAQQQAFYGTKAPISSLQVGDLVAWNNGASRGLQVGHIAIYAGNNQIIESYDSGKPARRRNLTAQEVNSGYAWGVHLNI